MNFKGKALPLAERDVATVAGYLGCHIAAVRAVLAIEAAGKGFDASGRPKMLFEPHIFYRELGPGAKRDRAVKEGLAYPKWKAGGYPKDSYPRLTAAMAIDQTAALRSASWGLGQVMGFNHKIAGFDTVEGMVTAMLYGEGAQLFAMARFIVGNKLQKHLRNLNWSGFAEGYNGAGFAKHGYHTRLADAYRKRPLSEKQTPAPASAADINALLGNELVAPISRPRPDAPVSREPAKAPAKSGIISALLAAAVAGAAYAYNSILELPCNLLNIFCGG